MFSYRIFIELGIFNILYLLEIKNKIQSSDNITCISILILVNMLSLFYVSY